MPIENPGPEIPEKTITDHDIARLDQAIVNQDAAALAYLYAVEKFSMQLIDQRIRLHSQKLAQSETPAPTSPIPTPRDRPSPI